METTNRAAGSYVCITGAAGGLGKAFAVECASRGWDLFLTDLNGPALTSLSESLASTYGVDICTHTCDLTDFASRTELFEHMDGHMDGAGMKVWCLINVAGLDFEGPFAERTREQIRTILRLNIEANLEMTCAAMKLRDGSKPLRIINVSSLAAFYPMPVKAMYASSKRFLLDFSMALREEIRSIGGTVTALCPAGLPTTAACIRAIDAQGLAGRLTTKNVGFVASRTIDCALKGRAVYIPGALNRVLRFLGGLVPSALLAHLIGSRWNSAHAKSSNQGILTGVGSYGYR